MSTFASLTLVYESKNKNTCNYFSKTLWTVSCFLSTLSSGVIEESLGEFESYLVRTRESDSRKRDRQGYKINEFRSKVGIDTYYIEIDDDCLEKLRRLEKSKNGSKKISILSLVLSMSSNDDIDLSALKRAFQMRSIWMNDGGESEIGKMLTELVSPQHIKTTSDVDAMETLKSNSGGFVTPKLNKGVFNFGSTPSSTQMNPLQHSYTNTGLDARLLYQRMHILSFSENDMDLSGHSLPFTSPALSNFDPPSVVTYPSKTTKSTIRPHRLPQPNDSTGTKRAAFLQQRKSNLPLPRTSPKPFSAMHISNIPLEINAKIQIPATTTALFDPFIEAQNSSTSPNSLFPPTSTLSNTISVQQQQHVLANIAVNEDLTCSYKKSKLYSSSVEGVVQLQLKSTDLLNDYLSLLLIVKDISHHIETLRENRQVATFQELPPKPEENGVHAIVTEKNDHSNKHIFRVSIPKPDHYFPVLRYKCVSSLRPVPIRVQTRIRLKEDFVRVALQISSNPANSDDLSDLSIIMSVPSSVDGSTLITSPEGGIWNESPKPSVLWCVSEIGKGEKFHLQAQFQLRKINYDNEDSLKDLEFPVEVKCQCMYAQLSDVEFEVKSDSKEASDDTFTTKIARRFRLSHLEQT